MADACAVEGASADGSASGPAIGQLSCSMASTLVRYVRTTLGEEAVDQVLRLAGVEYDAAYLEDVSHWIWLDEAVVLLKAAAEVTDDPAVGRRVGEESVRQHAGTPVATLLRSLGSPEAVYEQLAVGVTKFSTITELIPREVAPGRAVVYVKARPGYERDPVLCDWTGGLLSQPPALFGLPPAAIGQRRGLAEGTAGRERRLDQAPLRTPDGRVAGRRVLPLRARASRRLRALCRDRARHGNGLRRGAPPRRAVARAARAL